MKKILQTTKRCLVLLLVMISFNDANACALRGKIKVDTMHCTSQGVATLRLTNHTTASGTAYNWQLSNDGGLSWNTMTSNSGKDTQNVNPGLVGRMYRCQSVCLSGIAYSDTAIIFFQNRFINVTSVQCSSTLGGNDTIVLSAKTLTTATDTAYAKNFRWQVSTTNGVLWSNIPNHKVDTLKVLFTPNNILYRAFVSVCPLTGPLTSYPTTQPILIPQVSIGLTGINLSISDKDCVNDTARLSLNNISSSLVNFLKYKWYDSTSISGAFNFMGKTDSFLKVKVDNQNRFYRASVKLCNTPHPSKDSLFTNMYSFFVKLGAFSATYDCLSEQVTLDYVNRAAVAKSVFSYWKRSTNDSLNHTAFNVPIDTIAYQYTLLNNTNFYYKVYSKFCPTSTNVLDSSYNVNVKLKIDTGQLKASFLTCPNDSVYMSLLNYKDSSSFPLYKKWMTKPNGGNFWEDYTSAPQGDTFITLRMKNGMNYYRKSISLCPDKYAKKFNSTEASTWLPFQVIDTINCSTNMTVRVVDDTVRVKDYTGTTIRNNSTFAYQWYKSTNNKVTSTIVSGANGPTLGITQADKKNFFRRFTRICSSNTNIDTTNWSNLVFSGQNNLNGRAEVFDEICLNDSVRICVVNFTPKAGDTATYLWQVSNDDIHWTDVLSNTSNDSCFKVLVEPVYRYYRRLTFWCPSGQVDSSESSPLIYIQNLPWCETFTSQLLFGKDIYYNCWRAGTPVCATYSPTFAGGQIWSRASGAGKTTMGMSNWGPAPVDPKAPPGRRADNKLITPAFHLKRGKIYRFSFWHKETTANICWDSLYVTWGNKPVSCDITNKFGEQLTKFSFDQFNKFWSDFIPQDDGIYYFAINWRDKDQTTGEINFDDICLKEIEPCTGKSPVKGNTFAPSKIIDRSEEPSIATTYDKDNPTHQYCIGDTIMLTYQEGNYASNFDYYGMTYQFYKKRSDQDWKVEDTFFKPVQGDTLCHITGRSNYHVMNVLVTDTHTWYKIVATCQYDGKQYHTDSLLVNGTHSVPYCDDWEAPGDINNMPSAMPAKNSGEISGKVPSFAFCPTCWASYPQVTPTNPQPNPANLYSVTVPFRNPPGGPPAVPQLEPDMGWNGNDIVLNSDVTAPILTRKLLVYPAVRLYKGRGYRISFRWSDNRRYLQSPWGNVSQDLDSLYTIVAKGNKSGSTIDSFPKSKMIPGSLRLNLQSNEYETGNFKYRTYWQDYTPTDTGTYYFAIAVVAGPANGNPYRFQMDYFCIDTLPIDDCSKQPKFVSPLRIRISPDGKTWNPGDTEINPPGVQWCVGMKINMEVDFGFGPDNNWMHGWKFYWQRNTVVSGCPTCPPPNWQTIDSSNAISFLLTYKYKDHRLIIANSCNTKFDTIGPFKIIAPGGGVPWFEGFEAKQTMPQCWEVYASCRAQVKGPDPNEFNQAAKCSNNYIDMDFISPSSGSCPTRPSVTVVPPGFSVVGGVAHRFSFWYKDNGISYPIDSIKAAWSFSRPTDVAANRLINMVNGDIVKNSRTGKWRYYTTDFTPTVDTVYHIKVTSFNTVAAKRVYRTMFDNFHFKFKQDYDALVIAVDSPDYQCDLPSNTNLKVTVMNIGKNTLPNIPIKVQVNGGTPISYTVPGPISTNGTKTVYVPGVDLKGPKLSGSFTNSILVWTELAGEQDPSDDSFCTDIIFNELYDAPTDTLDSVCICSNFRYNENSPNGQTRWYRTMSDATPFSIGDILSIDSLCKDTTFYRSTWNGGVGNTNPPNFAFGAPSYSAAAGGLTFDNISRDTLLLDSVMVYANNIGATSYSIILRQFYGAQQITLNTDTGVINKLGKQWLPIKLKIPPGTDYQLIYTGAGGAALAQLPNFIFIGSGLPNFGIYINGDDAYPGAPTAYKYFFNMKFVKTGCESARIPLKLTMVPSPKFKLKDTNRVCSRPIYQICGPTPPTGSTYKYLWNVGTPQDTMICTGANITQTYKLSVTNEFGCMEEDSLPLIVDPSPIFTLGPDTSFCKFSPHTISTGLDSVDNVVTWSDNQAGVKINVLNPGTYIATAYNTANFCTAKDTVVVNRRELPVFSLGNDRIFCGSFADLAALAPNLPTTGMTYTWSGGPVITTLGIKKYWVDGVDIYGCKNTDTIIANLVANPPLELGSDQDVCGASTTLSGPVGKYYYLWSTTSTSRTILVSTPGTYYLTITDTVNGCQSYDSVKVTFKTVPVHDLGPNVVKCAIVHPINAMTGSGLKYYWKKPGSSTYTLGGATFLADVSGVYYCRIDNDCYNFTDSVIVTLKTTPAAALNVLKDTAGCGQISIRATLTNNYTKLQWSTPNSDTSNIIQVSKSGSYSVSLWNECGTATKSAIVRIDSTPVANFTSTYPDCMTASFTNLSKNGITYSWLFGDNTSSNIENPIHTYVNEGDYLVTLKTYNSCGFASKTLPIQKRIKNCGWGVGIQATNLGESQVYVYPNPTKDVTNIIGVGMPNGVYNISITNILGQKVYQSESRVVDNSIDLYINVSRFASGEYVVNISNDSESIVRKLEILK